MRDIAHTLSRTVITTQTRSGVDTKEATRALISNFKILNQEEIEILVEKTDAAEFEKGTLLLRDGQIPTKCYMVVEGCVRELSRVESFRGYWKFTSAPNNSSTASNGVQFDPNKMPRWLFEPMVFKFLTKGLEDSRDKANIPGR